MTLLEGSRLEIIEKLPKGKVLCRCVCGTEKVLRLDNITYGKTRSCGCLQKEGRVKRCRALGKARAGVGRVARVDYLQRFGKLFVLQPMTSDRTSSGMWLCRCDCGNLCTVRADRLAAGRREDEPYDKNEPKRKATRSCGCNRLAWVRRELTRWEHAVDYEVERAKERELRSAKLEKLLVEA